MLNKQSILVCQCSRRNLLNAEELEPLLLEEGIAVVSDLCQASAEKKAVLGEIASAETPLIHACHPRAVRALFEFSGHPLPASAAIINHRDPAGQQDKKPSGESDPAWFPVIDYDRCTSCGQCYEFCLFGVYEKDEAGRVVVTKPESCKNNCPACARICPETAIIFPKVGESPINGATVSDEEERKANVKINVDEILGDDMYAALNARKKKRKSLLNQKKIEKALAERKKCSKKNQ